MDQNSNYIIIEANMKISCRDYRLVLGLKRTWILAVIVGAIQIIAWALKTYS